MRITYSPTADAAYIHIGEVTTRFGSQIDHTEPLILDLPRGVRHLFNLDFDSDGRLLGIEVLGATAVLPDDVIRDAAPDGRPGSRDIPQR